MAADQLEKTLQPLRGSTDYVHTVRQELGGVCAFVVSLWVVYLLEYVLSIDHWGLVPRRLSGLVGIVTMTFLHGSFGHLLSNTIPLFVLLTLLAGSRSRSWVVALLIGLIGGSLLWLVGRPAIHIGASLLIFGLISFLISSGAYFERRPATVAIAILVGVLYGGTLLAGVLPRLGVGSQVSWDGHLCGALAGVAVAFLMSRQNMSKGNL